MAVTYATKRQTPVLLSKVPFTLTLTPTDTETNHTALEHMRKAPGVRNSVKMVGVVGVAHAEKEARGDFPWS